VSKAGANSDCSLLFTGLLINREKIPVYFRWLLTASFFHAAFEAMAVNELRYLKLHEIKVGYFLYIPQTLRLTENHVVRCRTRRACCSYSLYVRV
jgi:hypothetical protein